jgi:hypothetical protein
MELHQKKHHKRPRERRYHGNEINGERRKKDGQIYPHRNVTINSMRMAECCGSQTPRSLVKKPVRATLLASRAAESAHHIDDKAYHQNQAKPAAADGWTSKVKPAATEQEKQNNYE